MSDALTVTSRNFFERVKNKVALSIFTAAAALMLLGFCSSSGGQSAAANDQIKNLSGDAKDAQKALASGYGNKD
jgi:hypothetical protein